MNFDAYKIAVQISLIENVTAGLRALSTHFKTTNTDAEALEKRLKGIAAMAGAGGILAAAGAGGFKLLEGPLDEAKKYQTELAKFAALGNGAAIDAQADAFAKGMHLMGASARDNIVMLREATAIMGDFTHAREALPMLTKMRFGIESVMGSGSGAQFDAMFKAAIKVTELRGALVNRDTGQIDMAKFSSALDQMTKAYIASGGLVKPQDYLAAIKTGGVSAKMQSDEMFYYGLGHFMQESGGARTGTSLMSMFSGIAGGSMTQRVAERLESHGLLQDSAIHYGKTGHITKVDPGGVMGSEIFTQNAFKWINEVVVPKLKAEGLSGDKLMLELSQLFGIRTAKNLADQMVREQAIAQIYMERARKAAGIEDLYKAGGQTLEGRQLDYEAKLKNLQLELGVHILPLAIRGLTALNAMLERAAAFAREFPGATKAIVIGVAALSALALLGGGLLLVSAAVSGLGVGLGIVSSAAAALAGGVAVLGGGLAALLAIVLGIVAAIAAWMPGRESSKDGALHPGKVFVAHRGGLGEWVSPGAASMMSAGAVGINTVQPAQAQPAAKVGDVYLDGAKVGRTVMRHIDRGVNAPQTGTTFFDPNVAMRSPAMP